MEERRIVFRLEVTDERPGAVPTKVHAVDLAVIEGPPLDLVMKSLLPKDLARVAMVQAKLEPMVVDALRRILIEAAAQQAAMAKAWGASATPAPTPEIAEEPPSPFPVRPPGAR